MPRRVWVVLVAAAALAAASCSPASPAERPLPDRAFYYWRTTFRLSPAERRALAELHVTRLYIRMFDVEWSGGAAARVGAIAPEPGARIPDGIEAVPVVYLRADVFRHLPVGRTAGLARATWAEVRERAAWLGFAPRELQVDCDWTDGTRDPFFDFVRQLRAAAAPHEIALSATIRLHQVKYRERTGVPPVDRGMLMFYNMGRFSADPGARAIFDAKSAERYLARVSDYPLVLDVALPIWSWTLHVRDESVEGLMQSTDPDELAALPFLRRIADDRYEAVRNAFLHGTLLRAGDVLKIEVTGPAEARAAADMIAPHLAAVAARPHRTVSLFDLSERNVLRHGIDHLDGVFRAVR